MTRESISSWKTSWIRLNLNFRRHERTARRINSLPPHNYLTYSTTRTRRSFRIPSRPSRREKPKTASRLPGGRNIPRRTREGGRGWYSQISALLRTLTFMDMLNHGRGYPDQSLVRSSRGASHRTSAPHHRYHPSVQSEARPATEPEPLNRPATERGPLRGTALAGVFRSSVVDGSQRIARRHSTYGRNRE